MDAKLSIVVPVHNGGPLLEQQLLAVVASAQEVHGGAEVVLVDNRSTDGAVDAAVVRHSGAPVAVRSVAAPDRGGVAYARNVGIAAAASDVIAICDADDVVAPSWAPAMARSITWAAPYVTGPLDLDSLNPPWLREMRGRRVYEQPALFDGVVPFAHGCNIGLHRSLVDRIGGFDEELANAGGDDIEFGARAWHAGVTPQWEPDATVAYRFRPRMRDSYRQGRAYGRTRQHVRRKAPYIPEPRSASRFPTLRRVAWLVRSAPAAVVRRATRARWIWVLSQLDGQLRGALDAARVRSDGVDQ